jgi:flagella basal body P-ring formation protein FlgA
MRRLSLHLLLAASAASLAPVAARASRTAQVPAVVSRALSAGAASPGARVEAVDYRGPGRCTATRAEVEQPIGSSGVVSLRIEGRGPGGELCRGFARAEARVFARVLVLSRALASGESLDGAVTAMEREVQPGRAPLTEVAPGLAASRPLAAGAVLEASMVHDPSWQTGQTVRVVIRSGGLSLTQSGRLIACAQGRACAQLPSGRRVEGRRSGNELVLEMP